VSLSIPFVVIGDGDSLSASEKDALAERYIQVD
jgi:thiamine pyrophosphokinase